MIPWLNEVHLWQNDFNFYTGEREHLSVWNKWGVQVIPDSGAIQRNYVIRQWTSRSLCAQIQWLQFHLRSEVGRVWSSDLFKTCVPLYSHHTALLFRLKQKWLLWTGASSWWRRNWTAHRSDWQRLCRSWRRLRRLLMRVKGPSCTHTIADNTFQKSTSNPKWRIQDSLGSFYTSVLQTWWLLLSPGAE